MKIESDGNGIDYDVSMDPDSDVFIDNEEDYHYLDVNVIRGTVSELTALVQAMTCVVKNPRPLKRQKVGDIEVVIVVEDE